MSARPEPINSLDRRTGRSAFGGDAAGYDQSRPAYPAALFEELRRILPARPRMLEIGGGTGIASAGLLACQPNHLTIVEPDSRLCTFLTGHLADPRVTIINAAFPDDPVTGAFDLIACAAAFHWMAPEPALARARALLAPGGVWAMWWNCYLGHGEDDPLATRAMALLQREGVALPPSFTPQGHYSLNASAQTAVLAGAGFTRTAHHLYRTRRILDPQQAMGLYASFSFISTLPAAARTPILDAVGAIVRDELAGTAETVVVTALYTAAV